MITVILKSVRHIFIQIFKGYKSYDENQNAHMPTSERIQEINKDLLEINLKKLKNAQSNENNIDDKFFSKYNPFEVCECPCCFEEYSDKAAMGRIMPWECLHSMCFTCYKKFSKNYIEGGLRENSCPQCRAELDYRQYAVRNFFLHKNGNKSIYIPASYEYNIDNSYRVTQLCKDNLQSKLTHVIDWSMRQQVILSPDICDTSDSLAKKFRK